MIKRKAISKLGLKFTAVVILAAVISALLFGFLFFNRYRIFHLAVNESHIKKNTANDIKVLQNEITKKKISKNDRKAIRKEMHKFRGLSMYLYDERKDVVQESSFSKMEDRVYVQTASFLLTLYEPKEEQYEIKFYDGSYPLIVYSYQGVTFMENYLLFSAGICVAFFIIIIMLYIHRKMKYIVSIEKELKLIEGGDFQHTIIYKGDDEITSLAKQLNHLRNALFDNMTKEQEARKANEELVTSMSHDLRTPLTSLLGYLDILNMHIYKNEEDLNKYVKKSKLKAEQIKEMSDKLFNHFLVYSQDEEIELYSFPMQAIQHNIQTQCDELIELKYLVHFHYEAGDYQIKGDENMLHRIFDNIFSNIKKYASKEMIVVTMCVSQGKLTICFKNKKKKDATKEESTRIGLKSVEKMMKALNGNLLYENGKEHFVVELVFPCREMIVNDCKTDIH